MNQELKDLLALVKASNKPAREVSESYFETMGWSLLKSEWDLMSAVEREAFINKVEEHTHG